MEGLIMYKPEMKLMGLATRVTLNDVQQNKTTLKLAAEFYERKSEIRNCTNEKKVFGISTDPADYHPETDSFEYFIGIEVEVAPEEELPEGMVIRQIPENEYVVFTFKGSFENAGAVHAYLYSTWLKQHEYELADLYNIEVYDERNLGPESEESLTDLYFPIRVKQ
ncbi:GyrI-like domain-containing protein [Paenibacillus mesophilus]|uniref:GyrI-like domain-containing protein n=1 Tax=Paenibacillus mesophilus TaxID=2582849 RepID=UPI0013050713|nr:GyrI-like domain-containing protein [Paenibacillus mesophilus]